MHVTEAAGGGVRRHLGYILPALARAGVRQSLVVSRERAEPGLTEDLAAWQALGCTVHVLPMRHGLSLRDPAHVRALRRLVRTEEPTLLHAHATKAGLLARLAVAPRLPVVYSPHSFFFQELGGFRRWLARSLESWLARRTARFMLVAEGERELASHELGVPGERLGVVENGLPDDWADRLLPRDEVRARWQADPADRILVVPARLARQKGHDWLFRALAPLAAEPRLQVRLLGSGPAEPDLRRLARDLGIERLLRWDGYVPDADRRLAGADLALLPSWHEGLPYALLEGLAAGVPLLVSDIPGNVPQPELRGVIGTVPVGDVGALTGAIRAFLDRPASWRERAAHGPTLQRRFWSLDRQVEGLLACYLSLS